MTNTFAPENEPDSTGFYPIRTVSSLTGINAVTLRAWERRYKLIQPQRTPKGHRLYTREDVARIQRVLALLRQGISIGQVKPLLDTAIPNTEDLASQDREDEWQRYQTRMLRAISRFDEAALDAAYNDALSLYPVDLVLRNLATPLLQHLGKQWKEHPAGIAEEHFFSVYLRNKIGARIHHLNARETGPLLLISCFPGEYHEVGMLFFALAAVSHGYRVLLFGANLPLEQIPAVLEKRRCDAIVLSGSARPAKGLLDEPLNSLVAQVNIPVFVGGAISNRHDEAISAAGAINIGMQFQAALETIASELMVSRKD